MMLSEMIEDIHVCEEDMLMYERKYGILTKTFYESFMQGDEPPNDAWVLTGMVGLPPMKCGSVAESSMNDLSKSFAQRSH